MFMNSFVRRSVSVVAMLVLGLTLAYFLPATAEGVGDSSSIELSDVVLEDSFVRIEDDAFIEPDLTLDLSLEDDAPYIPALEAIDETIEANGLPKSLILGIKETYALNVKKATFKSSRSSIASVDKKGVITAKKKGTTKITVKSGKKTVGTCKVTVVAAPKKVELGLSAVQLGVKEKLQLNPTITEGSHASFTYTVKNKKIATVSKAGVVTAKKVGSTTVAVKAHNGKKATLKVTVKKAPAKVTLAPTTLELVTGETAGLAVTLPKKTASFMLTWTSDNAEVATVDEKGIVTAVSPGTANIIVETFNNKKAICVVTVTESTMEPRLLSPTNLYHGGIFDDATYPLYGEDDITLVWTAVKGAVRYDLDIMRLGYTGNGTINDGITIDAPEGDSATITIILKKDYLDGYDVQDRMCLWMTAYDSLDNEYTSDTSYSFRWIRDFNSLEYDFYYARNGKNDFISFPDGSGKITGVVLTRYYGKDTRVKVPAKFGGYPVRSLNQTFNLGNKDIVEAIIPEGVNEIGLWCFMDCSKLKRVIIPNTVKRITVGAFECCTSLKSIDIPYGVTYLAGFHDCTALKNINIADSVKTISGWTFENCISLVEIIIPPKVRSIKEKTFFGCAGLQSITIPKSVREIDVSAFEGCTALKTIRGSRGSYAQTWAEEHGYTFVDLGD